MKPAVKTQSDVARAPRGPARCGLACERGRPRNRSGGTLRRPGPDSLVPAILSKFVIGGALGLVAVGTVRGSCVGAEGGLSEAQQALAQGRFEAARVQLEELTRSYPECVPALLLRAQLLAARGDSREAEELFLRSCELTPKQPEPFFQLGVFYDSRQQHAKAAEQISGGASPSPFGPAGLRLPRAEPRGAWAV